MNFLLRFVLVPIALVGLVGCSEQSSTRGSRSANADSSAPPSAATVDRDPGETGVPVIELTDVARSKLHSIAREVSPGRPWRVRLEVVAGGCTGMLHKLDLDTDSLQSQDAVCRCGDVECVYAKDQFPYVQGSLIDWGKEGEKSGFKVTSPKQTKENREKTVKWMNEESEKRLKQIREDIDERIARLRKLTSHDPNNELAHFELAKLLMDDSKYAEAVKSFDRVLVIAPDLAKTYPLLGRCLVELKQKDRATEVLKKGRAVAEKQGDKAVCTTIEGLLTEMKDPAPQDAE